MKGFVRYAVHAASLGFLFLVLGFLFWPFFLFVPLTFISICCYPVMKLLMPEHMERNGY